MTTQDVRIRFAGPADGPALERLAQLDSGRVPRGDALVAEVGGELRAAVPVAGGQAIADPFHPTAALLSLLGLRARQLRTARSAPTRAPRPRFAAHASR